MAICVAMALREEPGSVLCIHRSVAIYIPDIVIQCIDWLTDAIPRV
jgi:hypothetical protein